MQNKTLWRTVAVIFCALVFFFALHAKTAVYNGGAPSRITPSTASKLWVGGQKLQSPTPDFADFSLLFWAAALCLSLLFFERRQARLYQSQVIIPPSNLLLWNRHRFLRPPPAR